MAAIAAYDAFAGALPDLSLWRDVLLIAFVLLPATFALVWLALPLRAWRGLAAVGVSFAVLALTADAAGLETVANLSKLAAMTAIGFWFLEVFERVSWVVIVACIIPFVDAISVWRGPTRHIVTERPGVFSALSHAFPVPDHGAVHLGLPDLLFFAVFLAAAARWRLRVGWTWLLMVTSFGVTMALALSTDPFGLGGLPALPLLAVAFLLPNADLLWSSLRGRGDAPPENVADSVVGRAPEERQRR